MMYRVAKASEYLVITGVGIKDLKLVKKGWVLPGQACTVLDLSPVNYTFEVQAMSAEKLPFLLPAVFTIGPKEDDEDSLLKFARLLSAHDKLSNHVEELVQGIIEGETRVLAAKIDVETKIISTQSQGESQKEGIKVRTDVKVFENEKEAEVAEANSKLVKKKTMWEKAALVDASKAVALRKAQLQGEIERMNALTRTEKLKAEFLTKAQLQGEADEQSISSVRKPMALGKDGDSIKNGGKVCNIVEEKIRRLPGDGETSDRKMKRKRSTGTLFARSIDGEGEPKRVMQLKLSNESSLQSSDAQGFRSGFSGSNSKLDVASLPASSNACKAAKNEQEKVSRDSIDGSNKERTVLKGNKFNVRDNNYSGGIYTLSKGKASRAPRTGPLMAGNSSSVTRSSQTLEAREQPSNVNKPHSVSETINRKRSLPTRSSSHMDMDQCVGQRPRKISRTRREIVVSPVLSCDEVHTSPSDVGTSEPLISKVANNGIQQGRVKRENVSSPSRLTKPIRNMKPASIKKGSKSGCPPLKKSSDRKAITRLGNPLTTDSPNIAGEFDDDREELLAAANFACNASFIGCSSVFWKKLEPYFAPVNLEGNFGTSTGYESSQSSS